MDYFSVGHTRTTTRLWSLLFFHRLGAVLLVSQCVTHFKLCSPPPPPPFFFLRKSVISYDLVSQPELFFSFSHTSCLGVHCDVYVNKSGTVIYTTCLGNLSCRSYWAPSAFGNTHPALEYLSTCTHEHLWHRFLKGYAFANYRIPVNPHPRASKAVIDAT